VTPKDSGTGTGEMQAPTTNGEKKAARQRLLGQRILAIDNGIPMQDPLVTKSLPASGPPKTGKVKPLSFA